jgi:hypothetical protein
MKRAFRCLDIFLAAVTALALGFGSLGLWYFGEPHLREIDLVPGAEASFYVLRLQAQQPKFALLFSRKYGSLRPELGHWDTEHLIKEGLLHLQPSAPGAKVDVEVRISAASAILEALPAQAGDMTHWVRKLIPKTDHPNSLRIPWPPNWDLAPSISPPIARVVVRIVNVEGILANERVTLALEPPVRRAGVEPGYEIFTWFQLWQLNLFVALLCAGYVMNNVSRKAGDEN